jgi:hypothetical protein
LERLVLDNPFADRRPKGRESDTYAVRIGKAVSQGSR